MAQIARQQRLLTERPLAAWKTDTPGIAGHRQQLLPGQHMLQSRLGALPRASPGKASGHHQIVLFLYSLAQMG
jgi:hypothetical protein